MISIKKNKNSNVTQIIFKGDISMDQAQKYKDELSEKLSDIEIVEINIQELTTINLLVLQILKSTCMTFKKNNFNYTWGTTTDQKFHEILNITGLDLKAMI